MHCSLNISGVYLEGLYVWTQISSFFSSGLYPASSLISSPGSWNNTLWGCGGTRKDRECVTLLVNTALISCNKNVQQDTEMALKMEYIKVLQNVCRIFMEVILAVLHTLKCWWVVQKYIKNMDIVLLKSTVLSDEIFSFTPIFFPIFIPLKLLERSHKLWSHDLVANWWH